MNTPKPMAAALVVIGSLLAVIVVIQLMPRGKNSVRSLMPGREWSFKIGDENPDAGSGTVRTISDSFSPAEAEKLHAILNSEEFQSRLKKYAGDEPVPKLKFTVSIFERAPRSTRRILIQDRPSLSPAGRQRGMMFGLGHQIDIEFVKLDPTAPRAHVGREPRCDFSLRDSGKEWVFFDVPAPDEAAPTTP